MSEVHVRKRRRRSNRTNEQLQSAVFIVLGLALTGVIVATGLYIFKNLTAPKTDDPVLAAKAQLAARDGKSASSPTLDEIVHEAYVRDSILRWRPNGPGRMSFAAKGFAFELTFAGDRAVFVGTAPISRSRDGLIDARGLFDFLVFVTPKSNPSGVGAAVVAETNIVSSAHVNADADFGKKLKQPSPTATASGKGKIISATATYSYDEAAKRLTYRMEIAKIGG